jgi:polar amino acid transport system ATP-binding protein
MLIPKVEVVVDQRRIISVEPLELQAGERVAVVGRSGSGKSTFLKMLAGLVQFDGQPISISGGLDEGETLQFSRLIDPRRLRRAGIQIAYVPQQLGLWFNMSVRDNITLPARRLLGHSEEQAEDECRRILDRLGLSQKINSRPIQLSGGEQQRVAIARAALCNPNIVLLDEITSALDPSTTGEILKLLPNVFSPESIVAFVTHQFGFARQFASQVIFFENGFSAGKTSMDKIQKGTAEKGLQTLVNDSKLFYSW